MLDGGRTLDVDSAGKAGKPKADEANTSLIWQRCLIPLFVGATRSHRR
jgi:hypothetical protein